MRMRTCRPRPRASVRLSQHAALDKEICLLSFPYKLYRSKTRSTFRRPALISNPEVAGICNERERVEIPFF